MLEKQLQSKVVKQLTDMGFFVLKLIQTNKNGIPDLMAAKKDRCIFIELKRGYGKARPLQEYRLRELSRHEIECYVLNEANHETIINKIKETKCIKNYSIT